MPITRLPPNTVNTIGSSQVLTDTCSLVKELIDNSLDAGASAIFVEISLNALDIIQVRDNGHGISPDDRPLAGNRHCTSKIQGLADLECIGGKSLGFRGEALASAAELSGSMVVSTRIEGEATAVSLTIGRKGEIQKEERSSLPVGTTIRINDFLKPLPVRRQTAVKSTSKSLIKIKKLLQSYALARSSVRLCLKLLKAKNDNGNWIYAPKDGDSTPVAARKIFGKDVAEQCQWRLWQPTQADLETLTAPNAASSAEDLYRIEALLPKSNYDPHQVSNIGQFISVDSRPVSSTKGIFKQIVGLFKSYLGSGTSINSPEKPTDPILCMNIICPCASYDVNVEPAKDDVLFSNAQFILRMFEDFFKNLYGELRGKPIKNTASLAFNTKPQGFEVLLARKEQPPASVRDQAPECLDFSLADGAYMNGKSTAPVRKQAFTSSSGVSRANSSRNLSMSPTKDVDGLSNGVDEDCRALRGSTIDSRSAENSPTTEREIRRSKAYPDVGYSLSSPTCVSRQSYYAAACDGEEGLRDTSKQNPWTFAKINTPIRQQNIHWRENEQLPTPGYQIEELDEVMGRPVHKIPTNTKIDRRGLLTPQHTQVFQCPPLTFQSSSPELHPFSFKASRGGIQKTGSKNYAIPERPTNSIGVLDTWVQRSSGHGPIESYSTGFNGSHQQDHEIRSHKSRDFVSARTIPTNKNLGQVISKVTEIPFLPESLPRDSIVPSISAVDEPEDGRFDKDARESGTRHSPCPRSDCDTAGVTTSLSQENKGNDYTIQPQSSSCIPAPHPDLAKTLEYEVRKQAAVKQWRAKQRQTQLENNISQGLQEQSPSPFMTSPYQNRYRRAVASLRSPVDDLETAGAPTLEYNDPRAYLIRAQEEENSVASSSVPRKRRKTSSLPLETVREESTVRDLILIIDTTNLDFLRISGGCESSVKPCDTYITSGTISSNLSSRRTTSGLIRVWEARVRELVKTSYQSHEGREGLGSMEIQINL